ncbi:hypothetical protein QQ045_015440 [Rhodiola kirilowii]
MPTNITSDVQPYNYYMDDNEEQIPRARRQLNLDEEVDLFEIWDDDSGIDEDDEMMLDDEDDDYGDDDEVDQSHLTTLRVSIPIDPGLAILNRSPNSQSTSSHHRSTLFTLPSNRAEPSIDLHSTSNQLLWRNRRSDSVTSDLISFDLADMTNEAKNLALHAAQLGSLGFGTSFLEWVASFAAM